MTDKVKKVIVQDVAQATGIDVENLKSLKLKGDNLSALPKVIERAKKAKGDLRYLKFLDILNILKRGAKLALNERMFIKGVVSDFVTEQALERNRKALLEQAKAYQAELESRFKDGLMIYANIAFEYEKKLEQPYYNLLVWVHDGTMPHKDAEKVGVVIANQDGMPTYSIGFTDTNNNNMRAKLEVLDQEYIYSLIADNFDVNNQDDGDDTSIDDKPDMTHHNADMAGVSDTNMPQAQGDNAL